MEWRTVFVAREREIASVRELLEQTRLLTLTGPGGIGKSRLAVEAISRSPGEFRGRVTIAELAPLRDHGQVLSAIAAAVGIRDTGAVEPLHVVVERLERTETLLLLDNFEHVVRAGPTVSALLNAASSLRILVTSRVALHLSGEQEYPVPPLEVPAPGRPDMNRLATMGAVALFVERARRVRPDFELSQSNADAVSEICRRLDGLPLAIELAASRLRILSPEALLRRLEQRLDVLTGGVADAPERQRTLRATIGWSYELLGQRERALQLRCAVFAGGFTMEAAQALMPEEEGHADLLDDLALLVDHNLLTASAGREDEPRFRMLETIREFALEQMDARTYGAIRHRHATYFLELAEIAGERLQGPEHALWLSRLTDELDNIRVALDWLTEVSDAERLARLTAAMAPYWRYYGEIREGQRWLRAARALASRASLESRAKVLRASGWLEVVAGNLDEGQRLLERSLKLFESTGDEAELARTLYHLGACLNDQYRRAAARRRFEQGLALARSAGAVALEGRILGALTEIAHNSNRPAEARELLPQALDASRSAGDLQRLGLLYNWAGWMAWEDDDRDRAMEHWSESIRLLRHWGELAFLGSLLIVIGRAYSQSGRLEAARPMLVEGIQLTRQAGAVPDVIGALAETAGWLNAVGAPERALVHWQAAEDLARQHGVDAGLSWPLPEVRETLRAALAAAGPTASPESDPVTLENALDDAERDVANIAISAAHTEPAGTARGATLTPREMEVLKLVVAGRSNAEIGEALFISRKTASVHVANIKGKLGATNRVGIVTQALASRLTDEPVDN
jgi:predicted ATPase/DNA-binding CsgD family transcriptional regulator